jgi:hypothetical protein
MTMTAVLYALLAAAIAAGFGYLFSGLLQGIFDLRQRPYWSILVAACVAASVTLIVLWALAPDAGNDLHLATSQAPAPGEAPADPAVYIQGLKVDAPALYAKVKASLQADLSAGKGQGVALANARDLLDDYIERKLPFLSDDVIVERFQLLRDVLSYLGAQSQNDICADLALGTKRTGVLHYLSAELVSRDTTNVAHIVTAARDEAATKLLPEEFKNLTNAAFAHSAQTTGIALEEVDTLLTGTGDPKKACMLMTGYFDALLLLSPSEAGPALRTLAAGEQSPVPAQSRTPEPVAPPTPEPVAPPTP